MDGYIVLSVVLFLGGFLMLGDGLCLLFSQSYFVRRQRFIATKISPSNDPSVYHRINRYGTGAYLVAGGVLSLFVSYIVLAI